MKMTWQWCLAIAAAAAVMSNPVRGEQSNTTRTDLTGTWQMVVQHDHGVPVGLVLKQEGTKVTGRLSLPQPHDEELALEGEYTDGRLKLSSTGNGAESIQIEIEGTMKDDGTLGGNLSGSMGQATWTAERLRQAA